ncbi:MAG: DUF1211 domain-containing protein [Candidatus Eremiobacteraeota bacterium]|nr:DUF1211 domain-containing protein [Candidatus Eremiobacteraeota bacterium]
MAKDFTLSKSRFEAFSDGVFAIAITLLVLEFHLPAFESAPTRTDELHALAGIWPQYLVYFASFATIGIMWLNHHAQFRHLERITYGMVVASLALLLFVCLIPFATEVLAKFGINNVTVVYYGIVLLGCTLGYNLVYWQILAAHPQLPRRPLLWNVVGVSVYPLATIIAYFAPYAGIGLFALLAIFYMLPSNVAAVAFRPK